jgi:hypothetical protein
MAHQEVSPLETASIHLELTTISSPYDLLTGRLGKPRSVAPRYTPPGPGSDAWVAVHRSTAIPISARPIRQPQMPVIENLIAPRRGVDEIGQRNMDALNQTAFSNLQSQRTLSPQSPTSLMQLPTIENLRPLLRDNNVAQGVVHSLDRVAIPYILNPAPTAQRSPGLPVALIGDLLAAQPLTIDQSTMPAPSVVRSASPEQRISGALHADAAGLESCPGSSTSPANSPHRQSESSSDTDSDATTACADAPSAPNDQQNAAMKMASLSQGAQPSLLVGKIELLSNDDLNALLVTRAEKTLKRKLDVEQVILQSSESSKPSSLESGSDSKLNSLSTNLVRNPITGKFRRRNMMDDFHDCMEKKLIQEWDDWCGKDREERGPVEGYEEGDSDLEFPEWLDVKEEREERKYL